MSSKTIPSRRPRALVVNTTDLGGGAERLAWSLFSAFERRGWDAWFLVGDKKSGHPRVLPFYQSPFIDYRPYARAHRRWALAAARKADELLGLEDFRHPYARRLLDVAGARPDLVFCVNLHGGYFDPRCLPRISREIPVFAHVADHWWLTGHCAYPLGCPRWRTGCGRCPRLDSPPAIRQDGSHWNWRRKQRIFRSSRLRVATLSRWILDRCRRSILAPSIVEARVVPGGVDQTLFRPGDRTCARRALGWPLDQTILMFAANLGAANPYKDYPTLRSAMASLAQRIDAPTTLVVVGREQATERIGPVTIRHDPYRKGAAMAQCYQAADVYVHAAIEEVFGLVVAEAMSTGLAVVASDVGGVPELVRHGEQGLLAPPQDPAALARCIERLIAQPALRERLGRCALQRATREFGESLMLDRYFDWFEEVLALEPPLRPSALRFA